MGGCDWTKLDFAPTLHRLRDQHELMEFVLRRAGGRDPADLILPQKGGKIADAVFEAEHLIVEIKTLTSDRLKAPAVKERVNSIINDGMKHGGPVIFGTVTLTLDQLLPETGKRALREIGKRVIKEVGAADKQIAATAEKLGWTDYQGVLVFVAPPSILSRDTIGWLIYDATEDDRYPRINHVIIGSTNLLGHTTSTSPSFLTFHTGRSSSRPISMRLRRKIGAAWAEVHGGTGREASSAELDKLTEPHVADLR